MVLHNERTSHPIALSFRDGSFWCYSCDSYITNSILDSIEEVFENQDTRSSGSRAQEIISVPVRIQENNMQVDQGSLEQGDGIRVDELEKELEAAKNAR
jgi:hypothetical protein